MSLEDLRKDMQRLSDPGATPALAAVDVSTRGYLKNELWPFMESLLDVLEEHEGTMDELTEQAEDFLHAETAQEIGKPITIGFAIADELEKRITPPLTAADAALRAMIGEFRAAAQTAMVTLRDISIPDDAEDDDDEDVEDGDDEGDGDEGGAQ